MRNRRRMTFIVVCCALCLACWTVSECNAQATQRSIGPLHVEEFGTYNALRDIATKVGIVIGYEEVEPEHESSLSLDFSGGQISDLLDLFARQGTGFTWRLDADGSIRVRRKGSIVSFGDITLAFSGANDQTREELWKELMSRSEVAAWLVANHCKTTGIFSGREFRAHNQPITIEPGRLTVSQLLDQIAQKSGANFWAILQANPSQPCTVNVMAW